MTTPDTPTVPAPDVALREALETCAGALERVLAGKPIRNADEALAAARAELSTPAAEPDAWQWRKRHDFCPNSNPGVEMYWSEWEALQPPYMDARQLAKTDPENYQLRPLFAAPPPADPAGFRAGQAVPEHVAEVMSGWVLAWAGAEPIAQLLARHPDVRIGTKLYTRSEVVL